MTLERRRLARNAESKARAEHDAEPWTEGEDEVLVDLWGGEPELDDLAMLLGRTREACRQRYYLLRRGQVQGVPSRPAPTTRRSERRPQWMDDEGLPEWYR